MALGRRRKWAPVSWTEEREKEKTTLKIFLCVEKGTITGYKRSGTKMGDIVS
jgi:hypothetical protein